MSKAKKRSRTRRAANSLVHQPRRRQDWNGLSAREILALYPACKKKTQHKVLDVLLALFNKQHTAKHKEVSFKTREERAEFLHRFFDVLGNDLAFIPRPIRATWVSATSRQV